jgi:two-component system CheB/CheR fusion protein
MLPTPTDRFRVVCLGGSAGALEAYTGILRRLPVDSGMAYVVAPHRRFKGANLLRGIPAGVTAMPIIEVEHGMLLLPNKA